MRKSMIITLCAVTLFSSVALSSVPASITLQGKLTDASGTPLPAGSKNFTFKIFDAPTLGNEIWPNGAGETQSLNSDLTGLWTGLVGALTPLTDAVFADTIRWLEITVDGTTLPRVRLVTGPYAYRVATVAGASGGTITSKVSIGTTHVNTGLHAFVAGNDNEVSGDFSNVGGGTNNIASGIESVIGGGNANEAIAYGTVIAGGELNMANGQYAIVGGGAFNHAGGLHAVVAGGQADTAEGDYSFIGGGTLNGAEATWSSVAGGGNNNATDSGATIAGGYGNVASGRYATVGGGGGQGATQGNSADGDFATVPGGQGNDATGSFSFAAGRGARALHRSSFVWADSAAGDFQSTAADQFVIRAQGGVGIGTSAPEAELHVQASFGAGAVTASSSSVAVFESSSTNYISILAPDHSTRGVIFGDPTSALAGGIQYAAAAEDGLDFRTNGGIVRMVIDSVGNVGIGDNSPEDKLDVVGDVAVSGAICATGAITANSVACPSDSRLKRNVTGITAPLSSIKRLRGVRYEWKREEYPDRDLPRGEQVGLIAQEVREVVPQAVIEQGDGYLAVEYSRLVPLLIEGMKEQQLTIQNQQERIERLEEQLRRITP